MFCFHQKIVYVVAIIRFVLITSLSARKCIILQLNKQIEVDYFIRNLQGDYLKSKTCKFILSYIVFC